MITEAADEAGISRCYGGIHFTKVSSNFTYRYYPGTQS